MRFEGVGSVPRGQCNEWKDSSMLKHLLGTAAVMAFMGAGAAVAQNMNDTTDTAPEAAAEATGDAIGNAVSDESLVFGKFRLGPEWILPAGTDG